MQQLMVSMGKRTSPTLTLVTLGKFLISFCLILSLSPPVTWEVELITLSGTLDI